MAMMRITSLMGPSGFPGILDPDSRYVESATGPAFGRPDEPKRNPTPGWRNTLLLRPCVLSFEPRIVGAPLQRAMWEDAVCAPPLRRYRFCHAHDAALLSGNRRLSYLHNDSYSHTVAACSTRA